MSDDNKEMFDGDFSKSRLFAEITGQMVVGAGAAAFVVGRGGGVHLRPLPDRDLAAARVKRGR